MNNMSSEIIEAVESYHKDDEDMIAECMLYLVCANWKGRSPFWDWLESHNRCIHCGSKLKQQAYKEPHPELDGEWYETLYKLYCPVCGKDVD